MPQQQFTRLAIVGGGAISRAHIAAIESAPEELALVAMVDIDSAQLGAQLADRPDVKGFGSIADLVAWGEFDAAIIATPHFLHFENASELVRNGYPVLVEKPLCITTQEVRSLATLAREAGVQVVAGQTRRHEPDVREVKAFMDDPVLFGRMRSFDLQGRQDLREYIAKVGMTHWLLDGKRSGGGVTIAIGVHQIDLMRYLGSADFIAVQAVAQYESPFINGAESQLSGILELSNGATGTLQLDYLATRAPFSEAMTLVGEHGSVTQHATEYGQWRGPIACATELDAPSTNSTFSGWQSVLDPALGIDVGTAAFRAQLVHFGQVVAGTVSPISGIEDNFNTVACIEALAEAARTHSRVEVEPW